MPLSSGGDRDKRTVDADAQPSAVTAPVPYSDDDLGRLDTALQEGTHPQWIGRYRIVQRLGEGGMGTVYKAEQRSPFQRTVALKLIRGDLARRDVAARFESERQALAWMDHPSVARVLDAGADPVSQRPYFVMEYVPGEPITRYCDQHKLTIGQRLGLFTQVCEAVAHAHQKMIVHRDLKPSNILVSSTNDPEHAQVKVIDFGIAKALVSRLTDHTLHTESGQLLGTPEYMSPEQAAGGGDVDTRSDIYSLGVILYELLAGALPFDPQALRSAGPAGIERTLREVDPPRPSTRLSSLGGAASAIASARQTQVHELASQLKSELEWIPLKALRKDRAQRYATASELAQDIQNYLENRPLTAGPESKAYRISKFIRRRRVEVIAGSLVAASLLAGIIGTTTFALRAERRAEETRQVADFQAEMLSRLDAREMGLGLKEDLLAEAELTWRNSNVSPEQIAQRRAEVAALLAGANFTNPAIRTLQRNIIDPSLKTIEGQFAAQPLVKARLLQNLAIALRSLTLLDAATAPQTEALEIRQRLLDDDHPDRLESMHAMGLLLAARGKWPEAEEYARYVLDRRRRLLGEDALYTLQARNLLADAVQRQGRLREAEQLRREVLEGLRRTLGNDDPKSLDAAFGYGQVLVWRYMLEEAEPYVVGAIEDMGRVYGSNDWRTQRAKILLGNLRRLQGRLPEAEQLFRTAYEGTRVGLGDYHRDTLFLVCRIGEILQAQGRLGEAEPYLLRATDGFRRVLGDDHLDTLDATYALGLLRMAQKNFPEAEQHFNIALQGLTRTRGELFERTLWATFDFGRLRQAQQRHSEAEQIFADVHEKAARAPIEPVIAARMMSHYGPALVRNLRYHEAEPRLLEAHERLKQTGQQRHERARVVVAALVEVYEHTGRQGEAARWRAELANITPASRPTTNSAF